MTVAYWEVPFDTLLPAHDYGDYTHEMWVEQHVISELRELLSMPEKEEDDWDSFYKECAAIHGPEASLIGKVIRALEKQETPNPVNHPLAYFVRMRESPVGINSSFDMREFAVRHWNWMYLDGEYGNISIGIREWDQTAIRRILSVMDTIRFDYCDIPESAHDSDISFSIRALNNGKTIYASVADLKEGRVALSETPMRAATT